MSRREIVGFAAAACVACCIGPILALLGAIAALGVAATVLIGLGGLAITAAAIAGIVIARRRRRACPPIPVAVPVELAEQIS